jgi:hypothetical protein
VTALDLPSSDRVTRSATPPVRAAGLGSGVRDDPLRKVAQLEEMVARTHERAAELYESWLEQRTDPATDAAPGSLRSRARRHREMAASARSVQRLAARSLQGFEARLAAGTAAPGKERQIAVLAGLELLRRLLDRRIEEVVWAGRQDGATWAEIASALRVTRQTAHERYRSVGTAVRKS